MEVQRTARLRELLVRREAVLATAEHQTRPMQRPPLTDAQVRKYNEVVRQLNTPWETIFEALESSSQDDVSLLSVEPSAQEGKIRLVVEARALSSLFAYMTRLSSAPGVLRVALVKHDTNERDTSRPLRMTADAYWTPLPRQASMGSAP
jgi:nitrate reductase NapAB chaperone NapD